MIITSRCAASFDSADRVFIAFLVDELPAGTGLVGIILAAVFSAAMSTLSSSLNSSATAIVTDWIVPYRPAMADENVVWISKLLTIGFGVVQIMIGIWAADFDQSVISNALAWIPIRAIDLKI